MSNKYLNNLLTIIKLYVTDPANRHERALHKAALKYKHNFRFVDGLMSFDLEEWNKEERELSELFVYLLVSIQILPIFIEKQKYIDQIVNNIHELSLYSIAKKLVDLYYEEHE
jgi:hypothetical protein